MPKVSISLLAFNNLALTRRCIESVMANSTDYELLLTDNGSTDGIAGYFDQLAKDYMTMRVFHNPTNEGFIGPNNRVFNEAHGDYFLCLNNDTTVGPGWLEALLAPLETSPIAALSGPAGRCQSLRQDFMGFAGGPLEYIEGSCLCGKTEILQLHGLFDDGLHFAYGEDSDLSLRLRQLGYTIHAVPNVQFTHVHGATSAMVPKVREHFAYNMQYLQRKWADYIRLRNFSHPFVLKHHGTAQQVLMLTPIIRALHEKQPASPVWAECDFPAILSGNPFVAKCDKLIPYNEAEVVEFDFTGLWEDDPSRHVLDLYAETAGVDLDRRICEVFPTPSDFKESKRLVGIERAFVAVHAGRMADPGTRWPEASWHLFLAKLRNGWKVALVGDDTFESITGDANFTKASIGLTSAILNQCAFFVGGDGLPLHLAQAVGCPVIGLFGATTPDLVLTDGSKSVCLTSDPKHAFTGARHRTPDPYICPVLPMETIRPDAIWKAIEAAPFIAPAKKKSAQEAPPRNIVIAPSWRKVSITAITTACHRPEAWALSEQYMARQTVQPEQWLVLDDDEPRTVCTMGQDYHYNSSWSGVKSLPNKLAHAIKAGLIRNDAIVFWENDDWYDPTWLERVAELLHRFVLVGEGRAIYYNVWQRYWFDHTNMGHASLCSTACRRSLFPLLTQICRDTPNGFIDEALWRAMPAPQKTLLDPSAVNGKRLVVGIKSMPGKQGYGGGHRGRDPFAIDDRGLGRLRELGGPDADSYARFNRLPEKETPVDDPKVEVHLLTWNEEAMLPYTLRHYRTFAQKIGVHDSFSTDRTREIARQYGAIVEDWDTGGVFDDEINMNLKNSCWKGTGSDWVICADCDELLWFPGGAKEALRAYDNLCVAMVKPHGFEMLSEVFPTTPGQIYDEVKFGASDSKWYAKPILFSPRRVAESGLGFGAHAAEPTLRDGHKLFIGHDCPKTKPDCFLLHFHQIWPVDRIAKVYDVRRTRLSENNVRNRRGNFDPGLKHALEKRAFIKANLQQVVP